MKTYWDFGTYTNKSKSFKVLKGQQPKTNFDIQEISLFQRDMIFLFYQLKSK